MQTIVNAIAYAAGVIANVSQGEQPPSPDGVNNLLDSLKTMLLPEMREDMDKQSEKVKELMKKEQDSGPFKVQSMVYSKRGKGLN